MDEKQVVVLKTVEHTIPLDILTDIIARFIINVPNVARENFIRICFQIELAHWFYLDFYVSNDNKLKSCTINEFAAHVFQHIPFLKPHTGRLNTILEEWREYKQSVPTYGAILLSDDLNDVLLVQSYWAKSSWGFPKGKVNEDEDPVHCAIREVFEETGFDITNYLDPNLFFESVINEQLVRLYLITGISKNIKFKPRTRYEIKSCVWFPIGDLPNNKKDITPKVKMGVSPNAFFMVLPFIKRIKGLSQSAKPKRQRHKSSSLSEGEITVKQNSKVYVNQRSETDDVKLLKSNIKNHRRSNCHSKRQLFCNTQETLEFCAPSWLNFKFDKTAIMECIP